MGTVKPHIPDTLGHWKVCSLFGGVRYSEGSVWSLFPIKGPLFWGVCHGKFLTVLCINRYKRCRVKHFYTKYRLSLLEFESYLRFYR